MFLNGKNWGICSRFPQVLRTTAAPEPTHPPGGRGCKISKAARLQDHAPSFGNASAEKRPHGPRVEVLPTIPGPGQPNTCPGSAENPTRATEGKRPHGPRVEVLPTIPGPGQLNTCPGQQGRRNRNTPGGGWNFPIFPTPLKSEFSEFWDTVKRGFRPGIVPRLGTRSANGKS